MTLLTGLTRLTSLSIGSARSLRSLLSCCLFGTLLTRRGGTRDNGPGRREAEAGGAGGFEEVAAALGARRGALR